MPNLVKAGAVALLGFALIMLPACLRSQDGRDMQPSEQAPFSGIPDFENAYIGPLASAVERFLSQASSEPDRVDRQTEFIDLNDDELPDALVLLEGGEFCSVDGCSVVVFSYDRASSSYYPVSVIAPVLTPLLVATSVSSGWRDLVVVEPMGVSGRSSSQPYVILEYDGTAYPSSPATGRRIDGDSRPEGELLF
jgi:hypothetical protein